MGNWRLYKTYDTHREMINIDTGQVRKVMLASDKQWNYLESLREKHASDPAKYSRLKNRPTVFACSKAIDKLLKKEQQRKLL